MRVEVELEGELPWRTLLGTPAFVDWMANVLPTLESTIVGGDITPEEQVYSIFVDYVIGEHIQFHTEDRRFKKLNPLQRHVWEFKTLDIRVIGWVASRDVFICTYGEMKDEMELMRLYDRYIALTFGFRNRLELDEPKAVTGDQYDDVLSDAN
ncbi:hypothetical protein AUC68_08295 [Methyloceanibacter methanicus]|uniref:Uncharacterized protein n=1 Tax=Methyloceanibacter methanicus TaxID=1774968 RepID=A0A1E3VY08_9HYPH|nr:hypothetical protein AUC68_08295 [Methyloceanibacter methanicus]